MDHSTDGQRFDRESGEPMSKGPTVGKVKPDVTFTERKYRRYSEITNCINETSANCGTGRKLSRNGI